MCSGITYYIQGIVIKERGPVFVTAFNPLCMIIVAILGSIILAEEITSGRYTSSCHLVAAIIMVLQSLVNYTYYNYVRTLKLIQGDWSNHHSYRSLLSDMG